MIFQAGDLVACWGTDPAARAISWGTSALFAPKGLRLNPPSHIAIIVEHPHFGPVWVESTTLSKLPCLFRGECVSGCQAHLPDERINEYLQAGGRVAVYRLVHGVRLTRERSRELTQSLLSDYVGRNVGYDLGGALISGTRLFKWTRLVPGADLDSVFCSELVAHALMQACLMNRDNPTRYNPACLLRQLVRQGTYTLLTDDPRSEPEVIPFRRSA